MMISEYLLKKLGFERLMTDYYKKGNYGLLRSFRDGKEYFINFNSVMSTLEELKEDYRRKTGEEL